MKIFVYKIAKDSFWLLKIYIVIVHGSVLINAREYEGAIKNGEPRETGNIGYTGR